MPPKAIDLFAGCGGLSLGLANAGFEIVFANEIDQWAAETYRVNHPSTELVQGDIHDISKTDWRALRGEIALVAGGPPCQGFSVSGRRQYGEISSQNTLVESFLDVVEQVEPQLVLIENVAGFRTAKLRPNTPALAFVLNRLAGLGYDTRVQTLQATDFGVPSLRSRLFVIGQLKRLSSDPFPLPTHAIKDRKHPVGCLDAISDLPPIHAGEGQEAIVPYRNSAANGYQAAMRQDALGVCNHVAMKHTPRLVERFATIPQGQSSYRMSDQNITVYKSNNQRLFADIPSLCITANFQSNYIHPVLNRNLTAREAARLMSYPDTFLFKGKRTLMSKKFLEKYDRAHEAGLSQYNQIGNSVPPLLAEALGASLIRLLETGHKKMAKAA